MVREEKIKEIIVLLEKEESFIDIYKATGCTDEEFLTALSIQQQCDFTTIVKNSTEYIAY